MNINTSATKTPVQPIYILVEYKRQNGEITYQVKKAFEVRHGNLDQGLKDIDAKMYDSFNYCNSESYANREMGDYSDDKTPLRPFWISSDEIMTYTGCQIIPLEEYNVLVKYL